MTRTLILSLCVSVLISVSATASVVVNPPRLYFPEDAEPAPETTRGNATPIIRTSTKN